MLLIVSRGDRRAVDREVCAERLCADSGSQRDRREDVTRNSRQPLDGIGGTAVEPTYAEQLHALLDPQDDAERRTVDYVTAVTQRQLPVLVGMIARAVSKARAQSYDLGWHERGEQQQR